MKNLRTVGLVLLALSSPAVIAAQERPAPAAPETAVQPDPRDRVEATYEGSRRREVFRLGQDYTLKSGEALRDLVVVFGDAIVDGHVDHNVVVIFGRAQLASTASIDGALVVIGGTAAASSGAALRGDVVVIGGEYEAPADVAPWGQHVVIGSAILGGRLEAIAPWLTRGLLWGRLVVPDLGWVWWVVAAFFLVYLALNLVFDTPVRACAATLAARPLTAFVVGLLVLLLAGPVCLLLAVSVIGIAVIPFVIGALLVAGILGKVGVARWIGMRVVPQESPDNRLHSLRSFAIGFAVIVVAYMIPVLGVLAWTMLGVLGLGGAALAFASGYRQENPVAPRRVRTEPSPAAPALAPALMASAPGPASQPEAAAVPVAPDTSGLPSSVSDLTAFPHAAFLDRLAAFVLDVILVLIVRELFDLTRRDSAVFLLLLAYHIGFWTWKGTTVGGIICQLRVVRVDGAPLRFVDALVRGLSSIFSLAVLGIGCLWILRDPERQAWHDKIAGTYVVRVPRNYPL